MVAFDRIDSGLPEMDKAFDHIRLGDNVVWQVEDLDHFKIFALTFARQAITDGCNLVYIRFASHGPLLSHQPGIKIYTLRLSHYFETFTVEIHNIIECEGLETFYIFDCLSELQVAWSTDLMMSNFFRLTCPFLFKLDTVAYFPILRCRHSFDAIARIRETTQILLDVYADDHTCYVHPLKVWQHYSPSMFLPHAYDAATNTFAALTDGIRISRFYTLLDHDSASTETQDLDSWDRFFTLAKLQYDNGLLNDAHQTTICRTMMTRDPQMQALILKNFTPKDFFSIRSRMIGGKACGMLLARKLVEKHLSQWRTNLKPHDSFYIGSDVFYSYIVQNDCWNLRLRQRTPQEYFSIAENLAHALRHGCFAEDIREKFRRMLEYFGQTSIIVRSSSILEDSFGNAFAGKYESVFCVNTGDLDTRLADFEDAVRIVYASTMNPSALEYRKRRDLDGQDEQMALLVQLVSGSWLDKLFMPSAAGVGYSTSTYRFSPGMDISAGMLRLVMGLGTRAVDRTEGDYPRLLSLSDPLVRLGATYAERHRFSQHQVDVLDTASVSLKSLRLESLLPQLP
ncbi:MAG: PEP/pyruvate-binding domain-containing protein [Eubacterium aggregans]